MPLLVFSVFWPTFYWLQTAIIDGQTVIRDYLSLTLSFNHDLVDGAPAARFTEELKELIECRNSHDELDTLSEVLPSHA